MTVYNVTLTEGGGFGQASAPERVLLLAEGSQVNDLPVGVLEYGVSISNGAQVNDSTNLSWVMRPSVGAQVNDVVSYVLRPGAVMIEGMWVNDTPLPTLRYSVGVQVSAGIGGVPNSSQLVSITHSVALADLLSTIPVATIVERVAASVALAALGTYNINVTHGVRLQSVLARAVGAMIAEGAEIDDQTLAQYIAMASQLESLGLADDPNTFTYTAFRGLVAEQMELDDNEFLKFVYRGLVAEGVNIFVLYGEPAGDYTAWAMNTRTNALTEYRNWRFNSFAKMGQKYIGANETGLYELNGDTDNLAATVADFASGYLEMADGKLSGLKGVYLGVSGGGTWLLKLVAGDGRQYVYQFTGQPGLMTTKVIVGKGIRSRYIRWELTQPDGHDFDMDSIEFVPMISGRRV